MRIKELSEQMLVQLPTVAALIWTSEMVKTPEEAAAAAFDLIEACIEEYKLEG